MKLFIVLLSLCLSACSTMPEHYPPAKSDASAQQHITFLQHESSKAGWLRSANYVQPLNNNDAPDLIHSIGAHYSPNGELVFIQMTMKLIAPKWYFVNKVFDEQGTAYRFVPIDQKSHGQSSIEETFAIVLTQKQLAKFASQHTTLQLVGKRNSASFTLSKHLPSAFLVAMRDKHSDHRPIVSNLSGKR